MSKSKDLTLVIKETEKTLAKYNAVLKAFPDAKFREGYFPPRFSSKEVNQKYNKLTFSGDYRTLRVMPFCELAFEWEGKEETIIVNSSPKYSRLAYIPWRRQSGNQQVIRFSRLAINLKNNNFKDDMMNDCRVHIMKFIQDNPKCKLDEKYLEPRLKKLLIFS